MGSDDSLVAALERAVAAEPDNTALRLHLAQVLDGEGRVGDALEHCRVVSRMSTGNR